MTRVGSLRISTVVVLTALLCASLMLEAAPSANAEGAGVTTMMSVTSGGEQTSFDAGASSISPNGRYVMFIGDDELSPDDHNGVDDLYLRDRVTGQLELISISTDGTQANDYVYRGNLSGDGRYVVFDSTATNLVPGDTNGSSDTFIRDRLLRTTERVTVSSAGAQAGRGGGGASISRDGRLVAFLSNSNDLVPSDTNGWVRDVFVHDRVTGETQMVSVSSSGAQQERYGAQNARISGDGRYVGFTSDAANLDPNDNSTDSDIYLHELATGLTTLISADASGNSLVGDAWLDSISYDGRFIGLTRDHAYDIMEAYVYDRNTPGVLDMVSISSSGEHGNWFSAGAQVSDDGRYVAFGSSANNLVPGDTNGFRDAFLHDRATNITTRESVSTSGRQGNGDSWWPSMSSDGSVIVFDSGAQNFSTFDLDWFQGDVFVRDLTANTCPNNQGNENGVVSGYLYDYAEIGPTAPTVQNTSCSYVVPNRL